MSRPSFSMWVTTLFEFTKLKTIEVEPELLVFRVGAADDDVDRFFSSSVDGFGSSESLVGDVGGGVDVGVDVGDDVTGFSFTSRRFDSFLETSGLSDVLLTTTGLSDILLATTGVVVVADFSSILTNGVEISDVLLMTIGVGDLSNPLTTGAKGFSDSFSPATTGKNLSALLSAILTELLCSASFLMGAAAAAAGSG